MQTTWISIGRPSNPVPPRALSAEKRHFQDKKSPPFLISKMDTISIDESVLGLLIYENHFCASRRGTREAKAIFKNIHHLLNLAQRKYARML